MYDLEEMLTRIKAIKKKQGYTNKTLAEAIGTSTGTIGKILSGDTKDPQISTIIKIAECLGVSADYLIFGKEYSIGNDTIISTDDDNIKKYQHLNDAGKKKAGERIDELLMLPIYQARGTDGLTPAERAQAEEIGREMGAIVKEIVDGDDGGPGSLLFGLSQKGKK